MEFYELTLCGLKRKLPLTNISKNTKLAQFSILGDVELVDKLADTIADKLRTFEIDYVVGPEVKVVPLIHGIAKRLGHHRFVVCRKSVRPYISQPIVLRPLSHFPKHVKPLVISGEDAKMLHNKNVAIIDDVISTGVTMRMMNKLMKKVGAKVIKRVAVIKQGKQFDEFPDLISFGELVVFKKTP